MLNSLLKSLNDVEARYKEIKIKGEKKGRGGKWKLNKVFYHIYPAQNSQGGGGINFFITARRTKKFIQKIKPSCPDNIFIVRLNLTGIKLSSFESTASAIPNDTTLNPAHNPLIIFNDGWN